MSAASVTKYRAAKLMGVSPATVQRMVERGELPEPTRGDDGTYEFAESDILDWIEQHKAGDVEPAEGKPVATEALGVLQEARSLFHAAQSSLQWLVKEQQALVSVLHSQLKEGLQGWSDAVRQEQASRLEAETVLGQERRKDKAVDAVLEAAPKIVGQAISARAGAKVVARIVALSDDHWSVLKSGASEILGLTTEELSDIEDLRVAAKRQEEEKHNGTDKTV